MSTSETLNFTLSRDRLNDVLSSVELDSTSWYSKWVFHYKYKDAEKWGDIQLCFTSLLVLKAFEERLSNWTTHFILVWKDWPILRRLGEYPILNADLEQAISKVQMTSWGQWNQNTIVEFDLRNLRTIRELALIMWQKEIWEKQKRGLTRKKLFKEAGVT